MGDVFSEQLIKKKDTPKDIIIKISIGILGVLVAIITFMLSVLPVARFLGPFALLIAIGAIYGAWYFITSLSLEYEYIYTNGEIDIDKISAKRKRKRLLTIKVTSFEEFDEFDYEKYRNQRYDKVINAAISLTEPKTYYATFKGRNGEKSILIFSPDESLVNSISSIHKRRSFLRK